MYFNHNKNPRVGAATAETLVRELSTGMSTSTEVQGSAWAFLPEHPARCLTLKQNSVRVHIIKKRSEGTDVKKKSTSEASVHD